MVQATPFDQHFSYLPQVWGLWQDVSCGTHQHFRANCVWAISVTTVAHLCSSDIVTKLVLHGPTWFYTLFGLW